MDLHENNLAQGELELTGLDGELPDGVHVQPPPDELKISGTVEEKRAWKNEMRKRLLLEQEGVRWRLRDRIVGYHEALRLEGFCKTDLEICAEKMARAEVMRDRGEKRKKSV